MQMESRMCEYLNGMCTSVGRNTSMHAHVGLAMFIISILHELNTLSFVSTMWMPTWPRNVGCLEGAHVDFFRFQQCGCLRGVAKSIASQVHMLLSVTFAQYCIF